jgi:alpha-glucosidase
VPEGDQLNSLAYQVFWRGKLVIDTSCMGLNIHFQEPYLGENVGLSSSKPIQDPAYNGLFADYLQNSTTGRRIQLEIRAYNDGVAFRYLLPKQTPLLDLLIEDEGTEFHFAHHAGRPAQVGLPYVEALPAGDWLGIFESRVPDFPPAALVPTGPDTFVTHLPDKPGDPGIAYSGMTPWIGPWRIVATGPVREKLSATAAVRALVQ